MTFVKIKRFFKRLLQTFRDYLNDFCEPLKIFQGTFVIEIEYKRKIPLSPIASQSAPSVSLTLNRSPASGVASDYQLDGLRFAFSKATHHNAPLCNPLRLACHPGARLHSQHPVGRQSSYRSLASPLLGAASRMLAMTCKLRLYLADSIKRNIGHPRLFFVIFH